MSIGFTARNINGDVLIDENYLNFFLHQRIRTARTFSADKYMGYSDMITVSFDRITTQEPPLLCGTGINMPVYFQGPIGSPGNWTGFDVGVPWLLGGGSQRAEFEVHVYKAGVPAGYFSDSDYGLIVRNGSNKTVFDSRYYPLRFGDFRTCPDATRSNVGYLETLPANFLPSFIVCQSSWDWGHINNDLSADSQAGCIMPQLSGNRVQLHNKLIGSERGGWSGAGQFWAPGYVANGQIYAMFKNTPFYEW